MPLRLYNYLHSHSTEFFGFLSGSSAGTLAYITWEDKLITIGLAFLTGFLGAAGASAWKAIAKRIKK